MSGELRVVNRQRTRAVDGRLLRKITLALLAELLEVEDFDLTIHLLNAGTMTRLNETHLQHAGSTDVITFDYSGSDSPRKLAGSIFVCVDEALVQARQYRVIWQSETVRYIIHGVLHLQGHDDKRPAARKRMKKEEGRLLRQLARRFRFGQLERK